jgi:hypothetical protein
LLEIDKVAACDFLPAFPESEQTFPQVESLYKLAILSRRSFSFSGLTGNSPIFVLLCFYYIKTDRRPPARPGRLQEIPVDKSVKKLKISLIYQNKLAPNFSITVDMKIGT